MNKARFLLFYFLLTGVSSVLIAYIFPQVAPEAALRLPLKKRALEQRAYDLMEQLAIETSGYQAEAILQHDVPMLRYVQKSLGLPAANAGIENGLPVFRWRVEWVAEWDLSGRGSARHEAVSEGDVLRDMELEFRLDGSLFKLNYKLPDSLYDGNLAEEQGRKKAAAFLQKNSFFGDILPAEHMSIDSSDISQPSPDNQQHRRNYYRFTSQAPSLAPFDSVEVLVAVSGQRVVRFEENYSIPQRFQSADGFQLSNVMFPLLLALTILSTVIIAMRRWRAYEMDFRFGIWLGVLGGFGFAAFLYLQAFTNAPILQVLISAVVNWIFVGGSLIFVWAVGESLGREVWGQKFIQLDLLRNRYFLHSRIGRNLIRGVAYGTLALTVWLVGITICSQFGPLMVRPGFNGALRPLSSDTPFLRLLLVMPFFLLWNVAAYIVFGMSLIKKAFRNNLIAVLLTAAIYVAASPEDIEPFKLDFLVNLATLLLVVWTFHRYNLLVTFTTVTVLFFLSNGLSMLYTGSSTLSGILLLSLFALMLIYGVISMYTRDTVSDYARLAPAFVKNISERERMQRELEIARDVQMSFLPHGNPAFSTLEIASRCEPALEVGGDYYDFVQLDENRLGICIGDVSGKGTQAAFYMTLTKGFLRALASDSASPAQVLTKLNALFYDNVKRGVFISMIYGVFDMKSGFLTLARAGHNPVLMHKRQQSGIQMINPKGIAIGMEKGITFGNTIQEVQIPLQPDDLFVFYTDGFPEAMNKDREEFGEERFEAIINKHASSTAETAMEGIFKEVRRFTRNTPQHDDMTIVVVRVNGKAALNSPG